MRVCFVIIAMFASAAPAVSSEPFNWGPWRELPVQHGGRWKPLDTAARETLLAIANQSSFPAPPAHHDLDPIGLYLTMLFEWRGWEHPQSRQLRVLSDWRPIYSPLQAPDEWDTAPLFRIDDAQWQSALGVGGGQACLSPSRLGDAKITVEASDREMPFSAWAEEVLAKSQAGESLTEFEEQGLELAHRLWSYQDLRMGRELVALSITNGERSEWAPLALLLAGKLDYASDPEGELRKTQRLFWEARTAFLKRDADAFDRSSRELIATIKRIGASKNEYPSDALIGWELIYNRWAPFRSAWILMAAAAVTLWLRGFSGWKFLYGASWAAFLAGLAALGGGFALRVAIAGRPPVSNMYESVLFVGFGAAVFGLVFEILWRGKYVLLAASVAATLALMLADHCPLILDPSIRPLEPALRSSFWMIAHAMTVTLSYSAFGLALGVGNITLTSYLVRSSNRALVEKLSRLTYRAIQAGVLLLAFGIFLGCVWADYSWGRFWDWDPKEVWALVSLLGYLAVLHAHFVGWIGHRGLAAAAVVCFSLVIMTWYGVNFVLGVGLHSYGFGGGGQGYVYPAVVIQLLYATAAIWRSGGGWGDSPAAVNAAAAPAAK
jgi:cytochrome c-type biogenesis protein CcsB